MPNPNDLSRTSGEEGVMREWQPIETAPKDGRPLLLALKSKPDRNYMVSDICPQHAIGLWQHARWQSIEVEDCGSMGGEYTGWMPDWVCLDLEPTHWMPLPEVPKIHELDLKAEKVNDRQIRFG
jgi:hypothetical protein